MIAVVVRRECQQRACVGVQLGAVVPEIGKRRLLKLADFRLLAHRVVHGERMEHPRLRVVISLFFDELLVEKPSRTFHYVLLHTDAGLVAETHAPEHVRGHEVIALALFPPTPTTVLMLKDREKKFQTHPRILSPL